MNETPLTTPDLQRDPGAEIEALRREVERLRAGSSREADLQAELAAKVEELEGIALRAGLLQEVTAGLSRASNVQEIGEVVASHGRALFGAAATLVSLIDGGVVRIAASSGLDEAQEAFYRETPLDARLPVAECARAGQALWLEDRAAILRAYPDLADFRLGGAPLQAIIALPLREDAKALGSLIFRFADAKRFDAVEREFLLTLASQCAQAISRARLLDTERAAREALQRQQATLETLLHASAALSSTLDSRAALEELARIAVPGLADWCAIDELDADGQIRRLAVQHPDPAKVALAHELAARWPPDPSAPNGVANVLRTGKTEWIGDIPPAMIEAIPDPDLRQVIYDLGLTSSAVVPLIARGRVLGALTLVQAESGRKFTERNLRFAEDLARRAALALDNARLYESAEAARAHLHGLFMQAPAAICILRGPDLVFELANEPYMALVGGRDLLGKPLREALPELEGQKLYELLESVYATGETFTHRELPLRLSYPEAEEKYYNVVYQPTRGARGRIEGVAVFAFEVTEEILARRQIEDLAQNVSRAEAAARGHADTLATINRLGRLISAELDLDKVVQAVTDAATALTGAQFGAFFYNVQDERGGSYMLYALSGAPREAFAGFPMPRNTAIFHPTFSGQGVVRSADITLDPRYGQSPPHHGMPPGHLPVRSYLAAPVVSRSGKVLGGIFLGHAATGVFDDRAETLAAGLAAQAAVAMDNASLFGQAQRLIAALEQTNRELDQFAYVTSHDLKAPLRGIASLSEWLEEDLGPTLDEDARKKLDLMRGRVRRMEALIQGILDYSRAGRGGGRREDVDVGRLLAEIVELLAPRPPAAVVIGGGMPVLHTERVALQQVLMNLVSNALKHAGREDALVSVDAIDRGDRYEFRVTDNGPGISPEFHDKVWVIFQTLQARDKVESTGIGLAIVKKIVESRGGRAWVEAAPSAPGTSGATFAFTWPKRDDRRA